MIEIYMSLMGIITMFMLFFGKAQTSSWSNARWIRFILLSPIIATELILLSLYNMFK